MTLPTLAEPRPTAAAFRRVRVVLAKELRDHLRDRRSLLLALFYPIFGPLLLGILLHLSAGGGPQTAASLPPLGIVGGEYAPGLVRYLATRAVNVIELRGDPALTVRSGTLALVLSIPREAVAESHFTIRLLADSNRATPAAAATAIIDLIRAYGRETSRQRLLERGLDPDLAESIAIERVNIGHKPSLASFIYGIIPPLVVFMIFLGAVYLVIDTTVGERERGSWEPLLTAPVQPWELLLGKAGAAFLFTAAAVSINLLTFRFVLGVVAAANPTVAPPPAALVFAGIFMIALPLMALAVVLQIAIASISRSMKEAQIYLGLLPLVPGLPGMVAAFSPLSPDSWLSWVPIFGQMLWFARLIAGDPIDPPALISCSVISLVVVAIGFRVAAGLFRR